MNVLLFLLIFGAIGITIYELDVIRGWIDPVDGHSMDFEEHKAWKLKKQQAAQAELDEHEGEVRFW